MLDGQWRICSDLGVAILGKHVSQVIDVEGSNELSIGVRHAKNRGSNNIDEYLENLEKASTIT